MNINYREILPNKKLSLYIKCYWSLEVSSNTDKLYQDKILPLGFQDLFICYKSKIFEERNNNLSKMNNTSIVGQIDKYKLVKYSGNTGIFAICFQPYGWSLFSGYAANDFANQVIATDLLSKNIKELANRLIDAGNNEQRITIANNFLLKHLEKKENKKANIPIQTITNEILHSKGLIRITDIAKKYNSSISKFERNFKQLIGLTPKQFIRLSRFKEALNYFSKHEFDPSFYDWGYYDQAHFIKEFKKFSGITPLAYFKNDLSISEKSILENADFLQ